MASKFNTSYKINIFWKMGCGLTFGIFVKKEWSLFLDLQISSDRFNQVLSAQAVHNYESILWISRPVKDKRHQRLATDSATITMQEHNLSELYLDQRQLGYKSHRQFRSQFQKIQCRVHGQASSLPILYLHLKKLHNLWHLQSKRLSKCTPKLKEESNG